MRVISGRFKGVALTTPKAGTIPTTDRTKEAIFSHLDSWGVLDDARVLDLFAGTGALGIEALSRGAQELVAVESSAPAATLIAHTLTALKRNRSWESGMSARVIKARAEKYAAGAAVASFDVIFIDPPYIFETEACNQLLSDLAGGDMTSSDTIIVLERSTRSDDPTPPDGWAKPPCTSSRRPASVISDVLNPPTVAGVSASVVWVYPQSTDGEGCLGVGGLGVFSICRR